MIVRKSPRDIDEMAASAQVLVAVHELLRARVRAGVTTAELDELAESAIREAGGEPAFKGYHGFTGSICASVNDKVVHGIPGDEVLTEGDLVSIDCGVRFNGWVSDCARSYVVAPEGVDGTANPAAARLIETAWRSLDAGIAQCQAGRRLGDVGHAIQQVVEAEGYGVIRGLVGHGIGRQMHEEPQVPNFGEPGTGVLLEPGFVLAIEPMITVGSHEIVEDEADGWSIYTADGSLSAHVEHTVAITADGPRVLTAG